MATAAPAVDERPAETTTDIAVIVADNPAIVLADRAKRDDLFAHIKREIAAFEPDLSTATGRKEIKSLAYKITRTKTAIDDAGKKLNEQARAQINAVDAARREAREELTKLAESVRRPLSEWEAAEEQRVADCRADIEAFKRASVVTLDDTSETVRERGADIWQQEIDPERYRELTEEAETAKAQAVATLRAALARLEKEEADAAELERLRADAAERERIDAEDLAAQKAVEAKRKYAGDVIEHIRQCGLGMIGGKPYPCIILIRELEEKVVVTEAEFGDMAADVEKARVDTLERVRAIQAEAEERSRREAAEVAAQEAREEEQRQAAEAQAERERQHEAELAAERDRAAEAERAAQAERDRIAAEEAARQEAERVAAAEQAKREADQEHRSKLKTEAAGGLIVCGVSERLAHKVVQAIVAGDVPHVSLRF